MLKIGDFSKFGRVTVKTLRYYDKIGLLKPVRVDELSGYRFYSADQLTSLNRITSLKMLGLSLDEIKLFLENDADPERLIKLLRVKYLEAQEHLREERIRLIKLEDWLDQIQKEGIMPINDVTVKRVEALNIASVRKTIPTYGDVSGLFGELCSFLGRSRIHFTGPAMALYYDHEFREKDVDVEVAVPVAGAIPPHKEIAVRHLAEIRQAAVLIHRGPYENFSQSYKTLMVWIESNGYQINAPNREVYIKGPAGDSKGNPAEYITEIQIPVEIK
jgi:effector-binding domain-containing protein